MILQFFYDGFITERRTSFENLGGQLIDFKYSASDEVDHKFFILLLKLIEIPELSWALEHSLMNLLFRLLGV